MNNESDKIGAVPVEELIVIDWMKSVVTWVCDITAART